MRSRIRNETFGVIFKHSESPYIKTIFHASEAVPTVVFMTLSFLFFCSEIRKAYMEANTANIAAEAGSTRKAAKKTPLPSKLWLSKSTTHLRLF